MRFVLASIADFESVGIPITTERQFNGQAIKHEELLTAEQRGAIRGDNKFQIINEVPAEWNE